MCFAIPGKVVEINGNELVVDYGVEKRRVQTFFDVKEGEYVVVSNKIVVKKVPQEDALEAIKLAKEAGFSNES